MKSIMRVKCDFCKQWIVCDSKHTVLGFVMEDGKQINACGDCICKVGELSEQGKEDELEKMYRDAGYTGEIKS